MVQQDVENKEVYSGTNGRADTLERDVEITNHDACIINEEPKITECQERNVPDKGWAWFVCLGGFLAHFIMGGFERSNGVIYLRLLSRFNRSATSTAWVMSIFSALRLLLGPVASAACNRFSCRFVVMLGSAICVLGVLLSSFVNDISFMYITYGLLGGLGRALVYTPGVIAVGRYFNKRRGVAVGIATSGVGFGCFLFPPTVELLFDHFGFSGAFLILSAVISNFFVCGALYRPMKLQWRIVEFERKKLNGDVVREKLIFSNTNQKEADTKHVANDTYPCDQETQVNTNKVVVKGQNITTPQIVSKRKLSRPSTSTSSQERKPLLDFGLFRNFAFCALCMQMFLFTLSINISSLFLPALAQEKGVSNIEAAYMVSILGICDAVCRIVFSTLLDLKRVKPYRLIIYNCVIFFTAIIYFLLPSMVNFSQFSVVCGLYGMLSGTYMSQKSVVVVDVLGVASLSSSFGFLMLAQGLSNLIGSPIGGIFKDVLGTYDIAFYFAAFGIFLGGLAMAAGNIWLYKQKTNKRDKRRTIKE